MEAPVPALSDISIYRGIYVHAARIRSGYCTPKYLADLTKRTIGANAAFIVRACNSHDSDQTKIAALVAALEKIERDASFASALCPAKAPVLDVVLNIRNGARAALAAAKGQP